MFSLALGADPVSYQMTIEVFSSGKKNGRIVKLNTISYIVVPAIWLHSVVRN
jgi:hypothetical protein